VSSVRADRMRLGKKDASGRQSPEPIDGKEFDIKADMVIKALGFTPEDMNTLTPELSISRWGTVKVNPLSFETNLEGVFAAGDIVRGASLVVWAIKEGRDAAEHIHLFLKEKMIEASQEAAE